VSSRLVLSESTHLRYGAMTVLYIAQGLPIGLFLTGISAWLAANGMPEGDVAAVVALVYLPWSFKFVGAALMDRYTYLPMGRRRIWLIGSQALMLVGLTTAALMAPGPEDGVLISVLGFLIFSGSAMQDVAVDGLAVDILPEEEQGTASAFMFGGQALGIAGGAALGGSVLDNYGSMLAFLAFTPFNAAFLLLAIVLRERPGEKLLPWTRGEPSPASRANHGTGWLTILGITLRSMMKRDSLVLLVGSAMGRAAAGAFTAFWPFFATTEAGYTTSAYSGMIAVVGLACSMACMGVGTLMIGGLGPKRATILSFSGYGLMALVYLLSPEVATIGYVFVIMSIVWNSTDTLTSMCSNPLRMRLSDKRVGATQFTIYNSLSNLPVTWGAALFAWASGAGGTRVLMPILIALSLGSCVTFSAMRIGQRVGHEEDPAPRVD
jgi:PAT family beta-lactamase induction signal transducer AmpG